MVAIEKNIEYLRLANLWPKKGTSFNNFWFQMKIYSFLLFTTINTTGCAMMLIQQFRGKLNYDFEDILDTTTLLLTAVGFYYIIACFLYKNKKITSVINKLNDFEIFAEPTNFVGENKKMNIYLAIYIYFTVVGTFYYGLLSYLEKASCLKNNKNKVCGLIVQIWLPFDLQESPMNEIVYIVQIVTCSSFYISGANIFGIIFSITGNLVLRIGKLKELLNDALQQNDIRTKKEKLKYCIKYHKFIIRLSNEINDCFSLLLFIILTLFCIQMGAIVVLLLLDTSLKTIIHFVGWFQTLFIISLIGQMLINESSSLSEIVYNISWYKENIAIQKSVYMLLLGCRKPLSLKAGNFAVISFPTFQLIMKNTYSYITLLNMVMSDEHK